MEVFSLNYSLNKFQQKKNSFSEIDDELDKAEVSFFKISEEGAEEQFGILELPALAFIQNGIPNIYEDDLVSEEKKFHLFKITFFMIYHLR
jgi:hypothetical protein